MTTFNPSSPPINLVLINPSTGQPYAPSGVTPVTGTKYGEGPVVYAVLIDPATGQPYAIT